MSQPKQAPAFRRGEHVTNRNNICPSCRKSGFTKTSAADGRPLFQCQMCHYRWTCGINGGEYIGNEQPTEPPKD
jgi:ribosomal protein L37AE/L43A